MTWLAADYDWRLIVAWMTEKQWPIPHRCTATYYRKKYGADIEALRKERREGALNTGLALKEERVERLKQHADALEKIKWVPDDKGRLWNEAAWRETLEDIAAEMGHRKQAVDVTSGGKLLKSYVIVSPSDWPDKDADIQTAPVADSAVA